MEFGFNNYKQQRFASCKRTYGLEIAIEHHNVVYDKAN